MNTARSCQVAEGVLRHHLLIGYFALANGFSWLTLFLLGRWLDLPAQLVVPKPTTAASAQSR